MSTPNEPHFDRPSATADLEASPEETALQQSVTIQSPTIGQLLGIFAALLVIISFFLPWANLLLVNLSGFQLVSNEVARRVLPSLPVLWIVPVSMIGLIALTLGKSQFGTTNRLVSIALVSAGALNVLLILYFVLQGQTHIPLLFGIYASLLGSFIVGGCGVVELVYKTTQASAAKLSIPTEALRAYTMMFALVAIWLFFQWATVDARNPYGLFLSAVNFSKLMQQTAVTGVLAVGMLMVIVSGQIDLSVGSLVGLAGATAALSQGHGLVYTLLAAIVVGVSVGAFQGALVAYVNVPAFIVTLGGLLAWPGVSFWRTQGATIPVDIPFFRRLGSENIPLEVGYLLAALGIAAIIWSNLQKNRSRKRHGLSPRSSVATMASIVLPAIIIVAFVLLMNSQGGVPIPFIVMFAVAILGAFLTRNTTFGRYLYAIGGNPDAARLSGINLRRHILAVFALMGALVGVAAILHTARLAAATPDAGRLMELDAIAACVIGGTSLMGGRGTVFGAIVGALIMASLDNGMNLVGVQSYVQPIVKGAVLVAAVGLDMAGRRRS